MNQIERSFAKLTGKPCWGVTRGFGSFLTLEFGEPGLIVREPRPPSTSESRAVNRLFARRIVTVRGRWHLWIHCCEWIVRAGDRVVGDWTTNRRIDRAARELNGQKLLGVTTKARGARTRFLFDLGAELETKPYDRRSEQWSLYEPTGRVLTFRADGMYQYAPGDRSPDESRWRKLQRAHSDWSRRR